MNKNLVLGFPDRFPRVFYIAITKQCVFSHHPLTQLKTFYSLFYIADFSICLQYKEE